MDKIVYFYYRNAWKMEEKLQSSVPSPPSPSPLPPPPPHPQLIRLQAFIYTYFTQYM